MPLFEEIVLYFFLFVGIYFEVFILFTYVVNRRAIKKDGCRPFERPDNALPSVTVIIPCWNEEKTVGKTIESLLALNYPKDKLKITVVNDGSTDKTQDVIDA